MQLVSSPLSALDQGPRCGGALIQPTADKVERGSVYAHSQVRALLLSVVVSVKFLSSWHHYSAGPSGGLASCGPQ